MELTTKRLRLRPWCDDDLPAFAALNSDPRVMQYMPNPLDFEHPLLPEGHPLRRHVLYRLARGTTNVH